MEYNNDNICEKENKFMFKKANIEIYDLDDIDIIVTSLGNPDDNYGEGNGGDDDDLPLLPKF